MKYFYILLLIVLFTNCKEDARPVNTNEIEAVKDAKNANSVLNDTVKILDPDIKEMDKTITIELKQQKLIEKEDEREDLQKLIIEKRYLVEKKEYTINFNYPLLNESLRPTHSNFNDFINEYYVNVTQTELDILESKSLCDSIEASKLEKNDLLITKSMM